MKPDNTDIARSLIWKILIYRKATSKKKQISEAERRHLLRIGRALDLKPRNND